MVGLYSYLRTWTQSFISGPVYFRTSRELGMESVVHFRAKLVALVSSRGTVAGMSCSTTSTHYCDALFSLYTHSCGDC